MDRILGIVGGTGPESTVVYYRSIIASSRERQGNGAYPRILINSVEASSVLRSIGEGQLAAAASSLRIAVQELAAAGAGVALLASNAVHLAYDLVAVDSPIPLLSIVDATADEASRQRVSRVGLLGLRFLVEAPLYPDRLAREGIDVVRPTQHELGYVHDAYVTELVAGIVRDETRRGLHRIIAAMRDRERLDAVILAGTELSLILTEPAYAGVPLLHTMRIHVERAVDWLLDGGATGDDVGAGA